MNISAITFPNFTQAQCREVDPEFFFPISKADLEERLVDLQSICGRCIHQSDCAEFALEENIKDGFWGGFTEEQRKKMLRVRGNNFNKRHKSLSEILNKKSHGWSIESIAQSMGVDVASVERTLDRGRKKGLVK